MYSIHEKPFFCSWSGGKDSCLALYRAVQNGGKPRFLFNMLREDGERSRSHGLPVSILQQQAKALQIPLITRSTSWSNYTDEFITTLKQFKTQGIEYGVFGDIDIDTNRQWCLDVCNAANLTAYHPLWQNERQDLLKEFINLGFHAVIVVIKEDALSKEFLGKRLTLEVIDQLQETGIDPSGENGEYHTVVTNGPIFTSDIPLKFIDQEFHDGYWFLNVR